MIQSAYVHVVDANSFRRTQIARALYERQIHAEIYEDFYELSERPPSGGALLLSDELGEPAIESALELIHERVGYVPFAVFSETPSPHKIVKAMSSGALDYLQWPCEPADLVASVHRVCDLGKAKARSEKRKSDARRAIATLSRRELDVLRLVARGASNKEAAIVLGISPRTVEIHRANMMDRLNAESLADAVRIGIYAGLDAE